VSGAPPDDVPAAEAVPATRLPFVRAFVFGRACAVLGSQVVSVAVGWTLYERTGSPWALGLVGLVEVVPVLLLFVAAGSAVDRFPRRRVAMLAHGLLGLAAIGLALASRPGVPLAWTYALLFVVGAGRAFSAPSTSTILPQLLAPVQMANLNAWLAASFQLALVAGPVVGGLLLAAGGDDPLLALCCAAAFHGVFVASLARVPARAPPPPEGARGVRALFAGFSFVRRNPVFLAAMTLDLLAVLLGGATALLPIFAKDVLDVGPAGLGWLRAAPGLGALVSALLVTRMTRPWARPGRVLLGVVVGFGLATIGFGLSRSFALSLAFLFAAGAFDAVSVVIRMTIEQMTTPDALRGRVSAITFVFIGMSNELGAFESGAAAALLGLVPAVVLGGAGTLAVAAFVALRWPVLARIGPLPTLRPPPEPVSAPA
jgi:MFS family permease